MRTEAAEIWDENKQPHGRQWCLSAKYKSLADAEIPSECFIPFFTESIENFS